MEQVLDWLNENELRAYPLLRLSGSAAVLPSNFILDLQLRTNEELTDIPKLKSVSLLGDTGVSVFFGTSSKSIAVFEIADVFSTTYPYYVRNTDGNLAVFGSGVKDFFNTYLNSDDTSQPSYSLNADEEIDIAAWDEPANIVIGDHTVVIYSSSPEPTNFNTNITGQAHITLLNVTYYKLNTTTVAVLDIPIEPTTCVEFSGAWQGVSSIVVAGEKKSGDTQCVNLNYAPKLPIENVVEQTSVVGDILFLEGYNFRLNAATGKLDLEVGAGLGLKTSCCTSFLSEEYLDCAELVSYINGIPPDANGNFRLNIGANVDIVSGNSLTSFYDPLSELTQSETANAHTLFVGLSFSATDLCNPIITSPNL